VRGLERFGDLPGDGDRFVEGDRAARDAPGEILAFDELHDERRRASALFEPVDGGNVRVIQRGQRLRFARQARQAVRIVGEDVGQDLDRDIAIQLRIAGAIDLAHSAFAQFGEDLVWPDAIPDYHHILANWATARSRRSSRANNEASGGGPPAPSVLRISYGPKRAPEANGILMPRHGRRRFCLRQGERSPRTDQAAGSACARPGDGEIVDAEAEAGSGCQCVRDYTGGGTKLVRHAYT